MSDAIRRAMAPTADEIAAMPLSSHAAVLAALVGGKGRSALDVGCGDGKFTWLMAKHFPHVAGIDMKAGKIAEANASAREKGVAAEFRVASAEAMPFEVAQFDVVVFSNSLHHISDMDLALAEAARVTKPGGLVYVMEPVPAGTYFEATRLVNDETEIRTAAYRALGRVPGLAMSGERLYRAERGFRDLDEWRADQVDRDPRRGELFAAHETEIRRLFVALARRRDGALVFDQVSRVNLLRRV
jgi:hypothetical protein